MLTLIHAFDSIQDAEKSWHLRGPFILASYEANLLKARRLYDRYTAAGDNPADLLTPFHSIFRSAAWG